MFSPTILESDGDEQPTDNVEGISKVVARALNKNQKLILFAVRNEEKETLYSLLKRLSEETAISLSTLKLNARILRELGLISYNGFLEITSSGRLIRSVLEGGRHG